MRIPTLAVIIPAYKREYLNDTLQSLSSQSDKDFTVYIGDDNSPFRLLDIIAPYRNSLNIVYRKFDENVGGKDLIAHWNRCLDMMNGEDYFCMFSDDDIMLPECVAAFHKTVQTMHYDVYHFNIDIIDSQGKLLQQCASYAPLISSEEFLYQLYTCKIDARMPEFIFKSSHFHSCGGFKHFDLAYRSDNATVVRCAKAGGIYTIPQGKILWRNSGKNVSATTEWPIVLRRTQASICFYHWLKSYYEKGGESCPFSDNQRLYLLLNEILPLSKQGLSRLRMIHLLGMLNIKTRLYYYLIFHILTIWNIKHRYHRLLHKLNAQLFA